MCGIYGIVSETGAALRHPEILDSMGEALRHRGPDGRAAFRNAGAAIGTERLRIIDLHERADQPFASPGDEVWLECNGEIYNAAELRSKYRDYPYRSHSDVETILPLYLDKGTAAIAQLDGMFGLAIRDNRDDSLILARDRAGEKPLFYARIGEEIAFASELQSVLEHPGVSRELDPVSIQQYLELGYVPEPRTMFAAVRRVPAGAFMRFGSRGEKTVHYWDPDSFAITPISARDAIAETQRLVENAVAKQVMSDVPIGVFVSGGLDSSILAALASKAIGVERVHTFSAQFAEESYDESAVAARVAAKMRTRHVPVRTDEDSLLDALQHVTKGVAEPLADPAILPTYLLARAAREHVKVVLSGEGADELFGGYPTYIGHRLAPLYGNLQPRARVLVSLLIERLPSSGKKVTLEFLLKKFVSEAQKPWMERHLSWFGTGLSPIAYAGPRRGERPFHQPALAPPAGAMLLDYRSYLRDNLLVKVDRATMLSSVEARAPFLDRDVSRFALSLPSNLRLRHLTTTKWVLKKAAEKWLPKDVIYRRKRGLSVPVAWWLNRGLRGEADRLLSVDALERTAVLNTPYVRSLLEAHRSGAGNNARPLWAVLMLQYWMERWV